LKIINSDSVVNTNLHIINSENVANSSLYIINTKEKGEYPKDFLYKLKHDRECAKEFNAVNFFDGICIINNKNLAIKYDMITNIRSQFLIKQWTNIKRCNWW